MKEDLVFSRGRQVWVVETPALLLRELEEEGSVGKKSKDVNCGSELEVRAGYLDSGGLISGGCGHGHISAHSVFKIQE